MTSRRDVDALADAGRGVVALARRDLNAFFQGLDLTRPELVRDALLEFVPFLVREYGDIAATVAAEWYEDARAAQVGGTYAARTAAGVAEDTVTGSVRYAAGHLFTEAPVETLALLSGAVQRFVLYSSRATVARNAEHDPSQPRFARVPTGAKTCAWCSMMASRGFVYRTREAAGAFSDWHSDCDCQVVAEWDRDQHHIDGYDPDGLYDMYQSARDSVRAQGFAADDKAVAFELRRMFPDAFTDGVIAA